ncbi:general secretion pathway protein GspB [Ghiorsea bivora]|uniref:general secretion pathway protein GspB n=1 Tax=Ghiorsea bivora TaxID=1485545 RepID=UPI00057026E7|nr:general secretion pathway protein GspB [Ghiorsea bivora]
MSYILDALNKAEKDRQQQTPTSIPTVSAQNNIPPQGKGKYGLYFIMIGLGFLMLWIFLNQKETPPQQVITPQENHVTAPKTEPTTQIKAVKSQPTQYIKKDPNPVQKKIKTIPNIMALDTTLRNQLPPITISAHVYSEETSKRMVIINNQVRHEQEYIAEQLQLTHITPHGIELQYQGTSFTMKVKDQWPPY